MKWPSKVVQGHWIIYMTSYQFSIVNIAIHGTIFILFDVEKISWPWNPGLGSLIYEFMHNMYIVEIHKPESIFACDSEGLSSLAFCRAMLCIARLLLSPGVCPSVTFVNCAKTNKDIFQIFSPRGSQAILVFPYQTGWRYSNGNHPNGDVECKGVWKNDDFRPIHRSISNGYS